jgi:DNA mismatch repair protein MutS
MLVLPRQEHGKVSSVPASVVFRSILRPGADALRDGADEPACFHDLNLDQVVADIAAVWPAENLAPFFHVPAHNTETVAYRQAVFRDLEQPPLRQALHGFVERMRTVHARLAGIGKLHYHHEKARAHLDAAELYRAAVQTLTDELARLQPASPGLRALRVFLDGHVAGDTFGKLADAIAECLTALDTVRYGLLIRNGSVTVRACEDEAEASVDIEETFAKFRRDAVKDYRTRFRGRIGVNGLNHIEAQVLDRIAMLHPQPFATLDAFCAAHEDFIDPTVARFAREVCFYLAWQAYTDPLRDAGLPFCLPTVDAVSKAVEAEDAFDIALAGKQVVKKRTVIGNGFALHGSERIIVVSGPNHGGKTTFARMFGQLHWLAALGCTVPGSRARLFLFDRLFTHFGKQENIETLHGKLQDDLYRIHAILAEATPRSLIVLNEIFASTTLEDALWLGRCIVARVARLDALAVCVTFLVELASFDAKTVSMVAEVYPHDPAIRTFKLTRRPADGLAHALAVANKHRVTREWLLQRIAP